MRCHQVLIFSLPLTIGGAVIATPVASPPIAALRMPAIYAPPPPPKPAILEVMASWYGRGLAGRLTTSGEPFDPHRLTAASTSLPPGSVVKVENPKNGRSVRVRINDCGPYVLGRSLDLSLRAAQTIGITRQGVARVKITKLKPPPDADSPDRTRGGKAPGRSGCRGHAGRQQATGRAKDQGRSTCESQRFDWMADGRATRQGHDHLLHLNERRQQRPCGAIT